MQPLSSFQDFSVSLLFPTSPLNERDEKKTKATKITNILLRTWQISNLTIDGARALTNSHYQRLLRTPNKNEIELELIKLQKDKIPLKDLRQVAACYGYQIIKDLPPIQINPLPSSKSS